MKRLGIAAVFGCVALVGCGRGHFSELQASADKGAFRYPIIARPTTMDPGLVQDGDTIDLLQQVYEGLVGWNTKNQLAPKLATRWDVKNGGKTYIFHLRHGVVFQDGRRFTAQDFKDCVERNSDPRLASTVAPDYLSQIVGFHAKESGKASTISGIKVLDPYTIEIDIRKPSMYFVGNLTYPVAWVFDLTRLKHPYRAMRKKSEMVGTGPFMFDVINPDEIITEVANPSYWGGAPKLAKIERPHVGDDETRLQMFKNGQLDLVQLEREDVPGILKDPKFRPMLHFFDRAAIYYVGINCTANAAFRDVRVRQAIAMSIDAKKIVDQDLDGLNPVANGMLPPSVFGYEPWFKPLPYDPAKARQLLAAAGYPNGANFPDLDISIRNDRPDWDVVAEAVSAEMKENLNINVKVRPIQWGTYLEIHDKNQLPFFHMRWAADYLDAQDFLSLLMTKNGSENHQNYDNPKVDALCAEADVSMNPALRKKLYAEAEQLIINDAAFIPIYFERDAELISPKVHGIRDSVFGHLPYSKVTISP